MILVYQEELFEDIIVCKWLSLDIWNHMITSSKENLISILNNQTRVDMPQN